jgi:hypothetical protein
MSASTRQVGLGLYQLNVYSRDVARRDTSIGRPAVPTAQ